MANEGLKICFIGSARYTNPLDATTEKKFRLLNELGELFVIGFSRTLRPQRFTQYAHFYTLPLLPCSGLRYIEFFFLGLILALWQIFRHKCHIMIAQSPYEGAAAAIAKQIAGWRGRKVALIIESHGDFEHDLFLQRHIPCAGLVRKIMQIVARFTLARANALRAISTSTRQQLALWRPDCKIVRFMAWTDIDSFLQAKEHLVKLDAPIVLYVGVFIPRKGILHLINAFAAVVNVHPLSRLVLVGREDDPVYVQRLQERIGELNLHSHIECVAEMPQQQLAQYMAQASVFVLPSLSEGLGRVVVEAMAAGTPVIGSCVGGISDLIDDGKTGFLVPPGDETALAEKIDWLLRHPEAQQTMGEQAYQFARSFFSAASYMEGYQDLCNVAQKQLMKPA